MRDEDTKRPGNESQPTDLATAGTPLGRSSLARRLLGSLVHDPDARGTTYLLLDQSASMGDEGKLTQLRNGALRFFARAWTLGYRVGAIEFSRRARVLQRATRDFATFESALTQLDAQGRTAMAAAIRLATRRLRRERGDRAILIITDGMPDSREATLAAAREARAQGITVIAVGTDGADEDFLATLTERPELARRVARDDLAAATESAAGSLPASMK